MPGRWEDGGERRSRRNRCRRIFRVLVMKFLHLSLLVSGTLRAVFILVVLVFFAVLVMLVFFAFLVMPVLLLHLMNVLHPILVTMALSQVVPTARDVRRKDGENEGKGHKRREGK